MAYQNKEHDYKRLERDIASGEINSVNAVILHGHEDYLVKSYEKRLKDIYVTPAASELDYIRLDGESTTADTLISHIETLPMMSTKRVVSIDDFPGIKSTGRMDSIYNSTGNLPNEDDVKKLSAYVGNIPDTALLVFLGGSIDTRKSLSKTIQKTGKIYNFEKLDRQDLASFIKKKFRIEGKIADDQIVREIINTSGYFDRDSDYDLNSIAGDVVKIASFSRDNSITQTDVSSVMSTSLETDVFALLDSINEGKKGDALLLIDNIMGTGESGFRLLGLIISQFELMLGIMEHSADGLSKSQIMNEMGIKSEFRYRKVTQHMSQYTIKKLENILKSLYETEKNIKTGIYNEKLAMTMFVAGI